MGAFQLVFLKLTALMLNKSITENQEKKTKMKKRFQRENKTGTKKDTGMMKKSFATESFDVLPFMKQKHRRQKRKEREKNKEPKASKQAKNKDKKEERKKEQERERERETEKRNWKRGRPKRAKEKQRGTLKNRKNAFFRGKTGFSMRSKERQEKTKQHKKNLENELFSDQSIFLGPKSAPPKKHYEIGVSAKHFLKNSCASRNGHSWAKKPKFWNSSYHFFDLFFSLSTTKTPNSAETHIL